MHLCRVCGGRGKFWPPSPCQDGWRSDSRRETKSTAWQCNYSLWQWLIGKWEMGLKGSGVSGQAVVAWLISPVRDGLERGSGADRLYKSPSSAAGTERCSKDSPSYVVLMTAAVQHVAPMSAGSQWIWWLWIRWRISFFESMKGHDFILLTHWIILWHIQIVSVDTGRD